MRAAILGKVTIMSTKPATIMTGRPKEKIFKLGAARVATPKPMFISFSHNGLPEAGLLKSFKDPKMGPEPMRVDWVKVYQ